MKKLVLFDIDGTLLWTDGAGRSAIHQALLDQAGTAGPIDGYSFAGKTDPQIVRELLVAAGHPQAMDDAHVVHVCRRYTELLRAELEAPHRTLQVYDGVRELIDTLDAHVDVLVGLLTGNIREGATLKLAAVGIDPTRFRVGAFGSDAFDRAELPAIAAERAGHIMRGAPSGEDVVIIGDTPADVTCGRGIGARAIGVATGPFDIEALEMAGAYAVFANFSNTTAVMQAIFA